MFRAYQQTAALTRAQRAQYSSRRNPSKGAAPQLAWRNGVRPPNGEPRGGGVAPLCARRCGPRKGDEYRPEWKDGQVATPPGADREQGNASRARGGERRYRWDLAGCHGHPKRLISDAVAVPLPFWRDNGDSWDRKRRCVQRTEDAQRRHWSPAGGGQLHDDCREDEGRDEGDLNREGGGTPGPQNATSRRSSSATTMTAIAGRPRRRRCAPRR